MATLYRVLMRLAAVVFLGTAGCLAIFMLINFRETNWNNVEWGATCVLAALAWVIKPPTDA